MTVTEFLLDRIAEDEKRAQDATPGPWETCAFDAGHSKFEMSVSVCSSENGDAICDMDGLYRATSNEQYTDDGAADAWFIANNDPARVLAECAAKRAIIELAGDVHDTITGEWGGGQTWREDGWQVHNDGTAIIRNLAAVYEAHIDYRGEWKP